MEQAIVARFYHVRLMFSPKYLPVNTPSPWSCECAEPISTLPKDIAFTCIERNQVISMLQQV